MALRDRLSDAHARFCSALTHRYFIRVHMAAMMTLVILSGVLASRGLLRAGLASMALRYPIAVAVSYLVFFGIVRIWLAYVCRAAQVRQRADSAGSSSGGGGSGDWVPDGSLGSGGGSGGSGGVGRLAGGGGRFGGAGSSASFSDGGETAARSVAVPVQTEGAPASSSTSSIVGKGGGGGGGGGGGLDGDGLLLLVLFILLVAAVAGAGAYLVYQAPTILSESAFQVVLASGLARGARNSHDPGWAGSLAKSTVLPFLLVLVLSGVFGFEAHKRCPSASTVRQVFRTCVFHGG